MLFYSLYLFIIIALIYSLFSGTKIASQFPLLAAKVYDDIIDNIEAAEQIAGQTYSTADRAYYEVNIIIFHTYHSSITVKLDVYILDSVFFKWIFSLFIYVM